GRRAWGAELSPDETPLEAGLSYAVALGKPVDFIGRDALLRQRERGVAKRLVRLTLDDPAAFAWGGEPILMDGRRVSEISSAGYSRRLGRIVAMGYARSADPQAQLTDAAIAVARYQVDIAGTLHAARLHDEAGR
ncbi:MAG TPA: glycine cleavage T C-terminal barrel domain-containing protein, partial [Casimicrobiaceae bacterium]